MSFSAKNSLRLRVNRWLWPLAALLMLGVQHQWPQWAGHWRMLLADAISPALEMLALPQQATLESQDFILAVIRGAQGQLALQEELAGLRAKQSQLEELQAENQSLRAALHLVDHASQHFITAQMLAIADGAVLHTALIRAGAADGVRIDQAVVNPQGLIGRVVETGQHTARVLLLTDVNSRIPVIGQQSRQRAILTGDQTTMPALRYVNNEAALTLGELLVTSGDGGVFAKGIPVGVVQSVQGGNIRVRPVAKAETAEWVQVVEQR